MTSKIMIVFLIPILLITNFTNGQSRDKLLSVFVLFRHGARSVLQVYPNDPYKDMSFWPDGLGQLTNGGKQQQYNLGTWLRNRYGSFLPERYAYYDVYVKSSDIDRTIMSAQCVLVGLFPPNKDQIWLKGLNWQPIPIHMTPESEDAVIVQKKYCPKYEKLLQNLLQTEFFKSINEKHQKLYKELSMHTGKNISNFDDVKVLYDTLFVEEHFNYTLPEWTSVYYPEKLKSISNISFAVASYTTELARLKVGPMLHEIMTHFKNATKKVENVYQKFKIYSGHDSTMSNVLNALGVLNHSPPYASCLRPFLSF